MNGRPPFPVGGVGLLGGRTRTRTSTQECAKSGRYCCLRGYREGPCRYGRFGGAGVEHPPVRQQKHVGVVGKTERGASYWLPSCILPGSPLRNHYNPFLLRSPACAHRSRVPPIKGHGWSSRPCLRERVKEVRGIEPDVIPKMSPLTGASPWIMQMVVFRGALTEPPPPPPSQVGQWSGPFDWPIVAVHMTLLPTGRVLASDGQSDGHDAWVWDPSTNRFATVPS
jgi:hypothetical protein